MKSTLFYNVLQAISLALPSVEQNKTSGFIQNFDVRSLTVITIILLYAKIQLDQL